MNKEKRVIIDPDFEEIKLEGYYVVRFYCRNCSNSSGLGFNGVPIMIKQGIKKPQRIVCPYCKCEEVFT